MELLKDLELVDVTFEDNKAVLTFLDDERGEIRQINFQKQSYDRETNKFHDDPRQVERVEQWSQEHFGLTYDRLAEAIGERKDIYTYPTFNSLFEVNFTSVFDKDMVGTIMEVTVKEVEDNGNMILIKFDYDGKTYASKMRYSEWLDAKKQYFMNPIKRTKQYAKFEEKFGISIENKDQLVGQNVMIEIKLAFGKDVYVEIKPFPKKKKQQQ